MGPAEPTRQPGAACRVRWCARIRTADPSPLVTGRPRLRAAPAALRSDQGFVQSRDHLDEGRGSRHLNKVLISVNSVPERAPERPQAYSGSGIPPAVSKYAQGWAPPGDTQRAEPGSDGLPRGPLVKPDRPTRNPYVRPAS